MTLRKAMLEQYDWIVEALGEPSRLHARITYDSKIIQKYIAPFTVDNVCTLRDSSLEMQRLQLSQQARDPSDFKVPERYADALAAWIEKELDAKGDAFKLAALATLDLKAQQLSRRSLAVWAFLEQCGLAEFGRAKDSRQERLEAKAAENYRETMNRTFAAVRTLGTRNEFAEGGEVGIEFDFKQPFVGDAISSSKTAIRLAWTNLSSGFLSLVEQFARIFLSLRRLRSRRLKSVLILIDEGDAYLHLDWQRQYVQNLNRFLGQLEKRLGLHSIQVLLATHSPVISGDFPSSMVQRLDSQNRDFKTFGNSLDTLVFDAFETTSIGSYAAMKISELRQGFLSDTLTDEDRQLIAEIGDEGLRRAITASENE
ncbi:hypothetical protein CR51_02090 [Caballeronia megalochromosomata]|nr:hypothetical protein CR51_02090 [Caballeronia megalochromosomata]